VVPLVFKTSERRAASLAGSIPVRLRHLRVLASRRAVAALAQLKVVLTVDSRTRP
jgi:hypothetical protein